MSNPNVELVFESLVAYQQDDEEAWDEVSYELGEIVEVDESVLWCRSTSLGPAVA
jgi:hypothetical protein